MPKGLKRQANKNKTRKQTGEVTKRPLPMADEGQLYGKVERGLGDRRFEIVCSDGETRIGRLRGKIRKRKKSWLKAGMWVICACRDFQVEKVDIIELLQEDEVRRLENVLVNYLLVINAQKLVLMRRNNHLILTISKQYYLLSKE